MRILVTGGAGFIGSHAVDALVGAGHKVAVLDDLSTGRKVNLNPRARFVRGRVQDPAAEKLVSRFRPDAIYHFAAQNDVRLSVLDPLADAETNVIGLLRLVRAALKINLKRFIFASTGGAIYGSPKKLPTPEDYPTHPLSPYGVAKLSSEHYLHAYRHSGGFPSIVLRLANIYGPRQSPEAECGVAAIFTKKMLADERPIIFGDGRQTRDYLYIADAVRAFLLALKTKQLGTYNIGTGLETDVNSLFRRLTALTGFAGKPIFAPARPGEERRSSLDTKRAKKFLNWQPRVTLEQGLAKTVVWQRAVLESRK